VTDIVDGERRSQIMRNVRSQDTGAEWAVRHLIFAMGYRYRLHCKHLPGKPDIVFSKKRKVIFVNGCFWHGHEKCPRAKTPQTNRDYWTQKISRNKQRDCTNLQALSDSGWCALVVWECELRDAQALQTRIRDFLNG
jgi:DNA mismatch endonuclease, patch repair protein